MSSLKVVPIGMPNTGPNISQSDIRQRIQSELNAWLGAYASHLAVVGKRVWINNVGAFIREKGLRESYPDPIGRRVMGWGQVQPEKHAVEGNVPHGGPGYL
jgi:hypothetical protein